MKNGLMAWNIVLTLAVGGLAILYFTGKKSTTSHTKNNVSDTAASTHTRFRIAYFEMDSIEANFRMVKDVKAEINKKELEYSNKLDQIDQTYRNRYNELMQTAKSQADI